MGKNLKISFIGAGNVAWQLSHAMDKAGHNIHQIISKNEESAKELAKKFGAYFSSDLGMLYKTIDLVIVAVPDDIIVEVADELQNLNVPIAHTSGSVSIDTLKLVGNEFGVFYPLQSFSKHKKLDLLKTPFFIEGSNQIIYELLRDLAEDLSYSVQELDSKKRRKLHAMAVVVNNFSNHLFHLADDYLEEEKIPFKHLIPLIEETVEKLKSSSPKDSQTGPARRGDQETINKHLQLLENKSQFQELYQLISKSIQNTYNS